MNGKPSETAPLMCKQVIKSKHQTYRLIEDELFGYRLQSQHENECNNLYSLELNVNYAELKLILNNTP
jgi:hypothetical protein